MASLPSLRSLGRLIIVDEFKLTTVIFAVAAAADGGECNEDDDNTKSECAEEKKSGSIKNVTSKLKKTRRFKKSREVQFCFFKLPLEQTLTNFTVYFIKAE